MVGRNADPSDGPKLHERLAKRPAFEWLEPRHPHGKITVADVHRAGTPAEHRHAVSDVWSAWEPPHATVRAWTDLALGSD